MHNLFNIQIDLNVLYTNVLINIELNTKEWGRGYK